MHTINRRTVIGGTASAALVATGAVGVNAQGAEWPNKPVRITVNYGPGGGSDNATRPFMERMSRLLGQQFVIENKGGASGAIGTEAIIRTAPDGYSLLATPSLTMVILPHLRKLNFDPLKDLVPVSSFAEGTLLVAVNSSVPVNSIQELVTYAKQNPGKLSWGTPGVGTYGHLICETFKKEAGVDILHVPYRSTGDVMSDFLSNVVQVHADPVTLPHVAAGKAKLLAVLGRQRRPDYPNVPMLKEIYPEIDFVVWFGIFAPVGTPPAIVAKMSEAMSKVANDAELKDLMHQIALSPTPSTPEQTAALLKADHTRYGKLIKQFDIRAE